MLKNSSSAVGTEKDVPSAGPGTKSLTEDVRGAAKSRGCRQPNTTVRVATGPTLAQILTNPGDTALLVAHSNRCGFCSALKDTLADAAKRIEDSGDTKPRILMFETGKPENEIDVQYVPEFFVAKKQANGQVELSKWREADRITTTRTLDGRPIKNIPFDALQSLFGNSSKQSSFGRTDNKNAYNVSALNHSQMIKRLGL